MTKTCEVVIEPGRRVYSLSFVFIKVGCATAVDWYNVVTDICIQYFIDHLAVIGLERKSKFVKANLENRSTTEDELCRGTGSSEEWRKGVEITFS